MGPLQKAKPTPRTSVQDVSIMGCLLSHTSLSFKSFNDMSMISLNIKKKKCRHRQKKSTQNDEQVALISNVNCGGLNGREAYTMTLLFSTGNVIFKICFTESLNVKYLQLSNEAHHIVKWQLENDCKLVKKLKNRWISKGSTLTD